MHLLKSMKEITKENGVVSDFLPDLGLCSSSASQLGGPLLLSHSSLVQAMCLSEQQCNKWGISIEAVLQYIHIF